MHQKAQAARLLFVDDEETVLLTLPPILEENGFRVTAVRNVAEALREINQSTFDVLIADLNIEKEGDGFHVVGAMRQSHPQCLNVILTAYPAIDSAIEAIQQQVAGYFVKPADLESLLTSLWQGLAERSVRVVPQAFSTISVEQQLVTLINVFTVAPENQQKLLDLLMNATKETIEHQPGFISANFHKSLDGTRVTNYAQWRTREDFEAMLRNPEAKRHMKEIRKIAMNDGHLCQVVLVCRSDKRPPKGYAVA